MADRRRAQVDAGARAPRASPRKLRLFACASVRRIEATAKRANGPSHPADGRGVRRGTGDVTPPPSRRAPPPWTPSYRGRGLPGDRATERSATPCSDLVADNPWDAAHAYLALVPGHDSPAGREAELAAHADILRCLFGNPFRPASLDPAWLAGNGGAADHLARAIAAEQRFAELPILADALEEAGCDQAAAARPLPRRRPPRSRLLGARSAARPQLIPFLGGSDHAPALHAIFFRQVPGDAALLRLAQTRFRAAGVLPEFYPATPDDCARNCPYRPFEDRPISIHLPRDIRVLERKSHDAVCAFASRFAGEAAGMVVHDQPEVASRFDDYVAGVRELDARLRKQGPGPMLFIEYAAGIPTEAFVALFEAVRDCPRISACIDISHIGIRQCQRTYERLHPGEDVCHLKWNSSRAARARIADVQAACATALPVVCQTVAAVARLGKPMHFHLHDGHPSSTFSPYGVSDHLSFFHEIYIPFSHEGRRTLPLLFGPHGRRRRSSTPSAPRCRTTDCR